jgi:transcriptional regulator with XRE-family HTH domain
LTRQSAYTTLALEFNREELADAAGMMFQQAQKYEKGVNRVGASRLQQFSQALGVPPSYFLEGVPIVGKKTPAPHEGELSEDTIVSFLGTREGAALIRAFITIKQKTIFHNVIPFLWKWTISGGEVRGWDVAANVDEAAIARQGILIAVNIAAKRAAADIDTAAKFGEPGRLSARNPMADLTLTRSTWPQRGLLLAWRLLNLKFSRTANQHSAGNEIFGNSVEMKYICT